MIDYRKGSDAVREAWFDYKATSPNGGGNIASFVAGFNARDSIEGKPSTESK